MARNIEINTSQKVDAKSRKGDWKYVSSIAKTWSGNQIRRIHQKKTTPHHHQKRANQKTPLEATDPHSQRAHQGTRLSAKLQQGERLPEDTSSLLNFGLVDRCHVSSPSISPRLYQRVFLKDSIKLPTREVGVHNSKVPLNKYKSLNFWLFVKLIRNFMYFHNFIF